MSDRDAADVDVRTKVAVYALFAETGRAPSATEVAQRVEATRGHGTVTAARIKDAYVRLRAQRVLVLEEDGDSIRMAPPFSGIPTQHVVEAGGIRYFANCAWDSLGIPAALHKPARIQSRCEQSLEPFTLEVGLDGPVGFDPPGTAVARAPGNGWVFHSLVPAAKWWDDIVFT